MIDCWHAHEFQFPELLGKLSAGHEKQPRGVHVLSKVCERGMRMSKSCARWWAEERMLYLIGDMNQIIDRINADFAKERKELILYAGKLGVCSESVFLSCYQVCVPILSVGPKTR